MELLDLPNEVLEKILPFLPDIKDIRSIRLTSPRLRNLVADFVGINASVDLHEKDRGKRDFYSSAAIGEAKILNMTSNNFTLRKPTFLRKVTFDGNADPSVILNFLKGCDNLKELDILSKMAEKKQNHGLTRILLPNLSSLELHQLPFAYQNPPHVAQNTARNYFRLLDAVDCPKLEICYLTMGMDIHGAAEWRGMSRTLLAFVKNGDKLNTLRIHIECTKGVKSVGDQRGKTALENEMMLTGRGRQMAELWLSFNLPDDPWTHFLKEQRNLKTLNIKDDLGLNGWGPLELGVRNNAATLRMVIMVSEFEPGQRLDFSAFSGCTGLKGLQLLNRISARSEDFSRDHFINFNIAAYCPNLVLFVTANITISRANIQKVLELPILSHLALLHPSGLGYSPLRLHLAPVGFVNGVDLALMHRIVQKQSVQCILLAGMVAERTEVGQLAATLRSFATEALDFEERIINISVIREGGADLLAMWERGSGPYGFVFAQL